MSNSNIENPAEEPKTKADHPSDSLPSILKEFTESGADGYLRLGTTVASMIADGNHKELVAAIEGQSSERLKQNRSLASDLLEQHISKAVEKALDDKRHELWIEAVSGGLKVNFDDYRRSTNEDVFTLVEAIESHSKTVNDTKEYFKKSTSFLPTMWNGVLSGMAFGLFLAIVGLIDNPLSQTAKTFLGTP